MEYRGAIMFELGIKTHMKNGFFIGGISRFIPDCSGGTNNKGFQFMIVFSYNDLANTGEYNY